MASFFKQLYDLIDGVDLTIRVTRKDGKMTMSILPDEVKNISPVIVTGTVPDFEVEFFNTVSEPINNARGLLSNVATVNEELKKEEEQQLEQAKKTVKAKPSKKAPKKAAPLKTAKKNKYAKPEENDEDVDAEVDEVEKEPVVEKVKEEKKPADNKPKDASLF